MVSPQHAAPPWHFTSTKIPLCHVALLGLIFFYLDAKNCRLSEGKALAYNLVDTLKGERGEAN